MKQVVSAGNARYQRTRVTFSEYSDDNVTGWYRGGYPSSRVDEGFFYKSLIRMLHDKLDEHSKVMTT